MKRTLRTATLTSIACFVTTYSGVAIASDFCRSDSKCGYFVCHHTTCNCCPRNGGSTWECVQGPCFSAPGDPADEL